jgi:hypothetical protein
LGEQRTPEAVDTLRYIESRFGHKYQWLRRPRIAAERAFRLAQWRAFEPRTIGEILEANEKRLIRSDVDALEAVVEAVDVYARRLRTDRHGDLDDFWNRPRGGRPTPKEEERASEKVCGAIQQYLQGHAVTADREVQIVRRLSPADAGGAPGSKPDVLCRMPAVATLTDVPIAIPIEVKLSFNPEARSGLNDQLVGRYVPQTAASGGVFVLIWMDAPNLPAPYKPLWRNIADARLELSTLAAEAAAKSGTDVCIVVIDASLPRETRAGIMNAVTSRGKIVRSRGKRPKKAKKSRSACGRHQKGSFSKANPNESPGGT